MTHQENNGKALVRMRRYFLKMRECMVDFVKIIC